MTSPVYHSERGRARWGISGFNFKFKAFLVYCAHMFFKSSTKHSNKKSSLDRYVDPTGELTNKSLKFGEWYVRNRLLLRQIFVGFLTVWCVGFGGYSLYAWGKWIAIDIWADNRMQAELTQPQIPWTYWRDTLAPQELAVAPVQALPSGVDKVDFLALTDNPNQHWTAVVTYHFVYGPAETDPQTTYIYPGQRKALLSLGNTNDGAPQLVIDKTEWQRFNSHQIANAGAYLVERFNFAVTDVVFTPASADTGVSTHSLMFNVINASAYSFWSAKFTVLYFDGEQIVGVKQIAVPQFRAGETRAQEIKSLASQLNVTGVQIIPEMDPYSAATFMAPGQ